MNSTNSIKIISAFTIGFITCPLIYLLFKSPSSVVVLGTIIAVVGWSIKDNIDRQNNLKKLQLLLAVKKDQIPKKEMNNLTSYLIRIDNELLKEGFKVRFLTNDDNQTDSPQNLSDKCLGDLCENELSILAFNSKLNLFLFLGIVAI